MIGLVAAYYFGKDRAHKQQQRGPKKPDPKGMPIVGFCAVVGGFGGAQGFVWGLVVGTVLWAMYGVWKTGNRRARIGMVLIVGCGIVANGVTHEPRHFLTGAGIGLAIFVGYLLHRLVWGAHVEPLPTADEDEDEDEDEDAEVEVA